MERFISELNGYDKAARLPAEITDMLTVAAEGDALHVRPRKECFDACLGFKSC